LGGGVQVEIEMSCFDSGRASWGGVPSIRARRRGHPRCRAAASPPPPPPWQGGSRDSGKGACSCRTRARCAPASSSAKTPPREHGVMSIIHIRGDWRQATAPGGRSSTEQADRAGARALAAPRSADGLPPPPSPSPSPHRWMRRGRKDPPAPCVTPTHPPTHKGGGVRGGGDAPRSTHA